MTASLKGRIFTARGLGMPDDLWRLAKAFSPSCRGFTVQGTPSPPPRPANKNRYNGRIKTLSQKLSGRAAGYCGEKLLVSLLAPTFLALFYIIIYALICCCSITRTKVFYN
jgi:hypothetical protein